MPVGDKQKRQARHMEQSYEEQGVSEKTAQKLAWETANKQDGGDKKSSARKYKAHKIQLDAIRMNVDRTTAFSLRTPPAKAASTSGRYMYTREMHESLRPSRETS